MDPGCGKQVSWQATPRPDRGLVFKRRCRSIKVETLSDDEGDLTEADDEAFEPGSTMSSFNSTLSSFDSTFSYTEDVKMFPDDISKDPSPAIEQSSPHSIYQTLTRTPEGAMVSTFDRSMDRLHLYETDSKAHSAFGMNPPATNLISHCPTGLPYAYPHYPQMAQAPFPMHVSNGFATCGPVVPHNIATASASEPHGLPNNSQMHGLPMHQLPTHGFITHGLPLTMDWINEV